jgi:hypothetical protein
MKPVIAATSTLLEQTTNDQEVSGKKFLRVPSRFGLDKPLNRRFRKQSGGLLIRGSEVRILPGALKILQIV